MTAYLSPTGYFGQEHMVAPAQRALDQTIDTGCAWPEILDYSGTQLVCKGGNQTEQCHIQVWGISEPYMKHVDFAYDDCVSCCIDGDLLTFHHVFGVGAAVEVWNWQTNTLLWSTLCYGQPPLLNKQQLIIIEKALNEKARITIREKATGLVHCIIEDPAIFAFSPLVVDEEYLIAGTMYGIKVWDTHDGRYIPKFADIRGKVIHLLQHNKELICVCENSITIWDMQSGALVHTLRGAPGDTFSPNPPCIDEEVIIASCDHEKHLTGWNRKTGIGLFAVETTGMPKVLDESYIITSKESYLEIRNKYDGSLLRLLDKGRGLGSIWDDVEIVNQLICCRLHREKVFNIWNKDHGSLIFSIEGVLSFKIKDNRLCLAFENGAIQVCDFPPR